MIQKETNINNDIALEKLWENDTSKKNEAWIESHS